MGSVVPKVRNASINSHTSGLGVQRVQQVLLIHVGKKNQTVYEMFLKEHRPFSAPGDPAASRVAGWVLFPTCCCHRDARAVTAAGPGSCHLLHLRGHPCCHVQLLVAQGSAVPVDAVPRHSPWLQALWHCLESQDVLEQGQGRQTNVTREVAAWPQAWSSAGRARCVPAGHRDQGMALVSCCHHTELE